MGQPRAIFRDYQAQESLRSDRSAGDRARHRRKVRDAIRENIADIIAEQPIIGRSKDTIIKIPVRGIKEFRFVFGKGKEGQGSEGAGTGDGNSRPGQVIKKAGEQSKAGQPGEGGEETGVDYYETDITLEELIDIMFEDLELPEMERRKMRETMSERMLKPAGVQRAGSPARLDKKKTIRSLLRRRIAGGYTASNLKDDREPPSLRRDDLRYTRRKPKIRKESNAAVLCIIDTSASMDTMKKYLARSFFFLLYQFVRTRYRNVEVAFIAHDTQAKEVNEYEFFHKGESGGTMISSGYKKALEIINDRYHPDIWNLYAFHASDGDNFSHDNDDMLKCAKQLCKVCNLFGYGQIKSWGDGLIDLFEEKLKESNFKAVTFSDKEEIWPAFQSLLEKDKHVESLSGSNMGANHV